MIPLYGFLEGDTLGILILVENEDTLAEVAAKLQRAARLRCATSPEVAVHYHQRVLPGHWTVRQAGIEPLERLDVVCGQTPPRENEF